MVYMDWVAFHHPDISWPVVRRRAGAELMELLDLASLFLTRGGWGVLTKSCYPNNALYRNATGRLRQKGLVVRRDGAETPRLTLTETGEDMLPAYFRPERYWDKKWNKIWYLLVYDVPEVDRVYRNVFRRFLKRMRMGCLQQSVWVAARDIRPDFDDLSLAASADAFAYLFEARTVLGLESGAVVDGAWDFKELQEVQERYCEVMRQNLVRLGDGGHGPGDLARLTRMSLDAYHAAMVNDPLLPRILHPAGYLGDKVHSLHRALFVEINVQLDATSS